MSYHGKRFMGFTLMEVMVVVIIVGIIAGFGIPGYSKMVERTHIRDAMSQLRMIHSAQKMYFVKYNAYFPPSGAGNSDLSGLNEALDLNISSGKFTYTCNDTTNDSTFECVAVPGDGSYRIRVNQTNLFVQTTPASGNPICLNGTKTCPLF